MRILGTAARPANVTSLELDGGDGAETTNQGAYEVGANAPVHFYDDAGSWNGHHTESLIGNFTFLFTTKSESCQINLKMNFKRRMPY